MQSYVLNRQQTRYVDRLAIEQYGISGVVLMENAGRGIVDGMERVSLLPDATRSSAPCPVLIACGKGNNAGDGFVIARHLILRGYAAQVAVWAEPDELQGDAGINFCAIRQLGVPLVMMGNRHDADRLAASLENAAVVVDALLGTGARGEPRPPFGEVIRQVNDSKLPIVAVDLPSGLDCDTGEPASATIRAGHTFTLLALKPGLIAPSASGYVGQLHVCDIGVPSRVIDEVLAEGAG
ncbi:MAG: NAD(P)H-hydrate epimerase [Planctomycetota bacterium]